MSDWGGRWHGDPENNGDTVPYCPRYPYGRGFYASPLEPTGLHVLGSPVLDDTEMVKSSDGSKLVEETNNVAGGCAEGGKTVDLFNCLDGSGRCGTELWKNSDELQPAMVPSEKLKALKFDDVPTMIGFYDLKPSASPSIMAGTEAPRDAPMDPLVCPNLTLALESQINLGLDAVEQTPGNSSKMMGCCSSQRRENGAAIVPSKSLMNFVKAEQPLLGAVVACERDPSLRRASASRRFPYGCGPQAPVLTKQEIEEFRARAKCRTASSSKMRKIGIGTHAEGVCESKFLSRLIVKESGGEINTAVKNLKCIEKFAAQKVVKKENVRCDGAFPGHGNKVASGHGNTASLKKEKGLPITLAKDHSRHAGKAIVVPVNKGKAIVMYEEHLLPTEGKRSFQPDQETTVQCYKNCSPQQFEKCRKLMNNQKMKPEQTDARENVKRILRYFKLLLDKHMRTKCLGSSTRPDLKIVGILKAHGMTPARKYLGQVPGVEIGDEFHYRGELMAIGLHGRTVHGIDYMEYEGRDVATCIISSGVYDNVVDGNGVLIYSGEGGNPDFEHKRKTTAGDQKLKCGNLALKNSRDTKTPVRVIHGFGDLSASYSLKSGARAVRTYVYDGLYEVEDCWKEMGKGGYSIFKFQLRRLPGQSELALKQVKNVRGVKVPQDRRVDDITQVQKKKLPWH